MIKLIINADDFGLTEGINHAIRDAHVGGILTSATLLANGKALSSALRIASQNPDLGVGLHLNLVQGEPVSVPERIATLVDGNGKLKRGVSELIQADRAGKVCRKEIELELRSQIEKVMQHGLIPTHFDGHKHFHIWPPFFAIVRRLAVEYRIPAIRLARCPIFKSWPSLGRKRRVSQQILKQYLLSLSLSLLSRINRIGSSTLPFKSPDWLWGVSETGFWDEHTLPCILKKLRTGVNELMCHPGYVDVALREYPTRLLNQREVELKSLISPGWRELMIRQQIRLIHYGNI